MIKKLALIFCISFFVCSFSNALAETNKKEALQEGQAYKMLYEDTKDANSKILDNVYFALTFAGGFILLFLGSNAWFASRSRKNEFEALQQENKVEILKIKNDLRGEMQSHFDSLRENYQKELSEKINEHFEEFQKEKQKLERSLQRMDGRINGLRYELNLTKGDFAFEKGDFYIALSFYILDAKYLWETSIHEDANGEPFYDLTLASSLDKLHEVLLKIQSIDLQKYNTISDFVKELPQQYSIIVQKINETLKDLEKTPL